MLKLVKLPVLVSWDITSSIMVSVPMIGNQQYSSAQASQYAELYKLELDLQLIDL